MSSVFGAELGVDGGVGVVGALVEEGEVRGAQHPVGRGDGGDHPTSGVADEERLRAALRCVLGVVPNNCVCEDGVEFLTFEGDWVPVPEAFDVVVGVGPVES